jgi:Ni/Co efflux regulator RcnB
MNSAAPRLLLLLLLCLASTSALAQQLAQQPQLAQPKNQVQQSTRELTAQRPHFPAYRHWQIGDQMNPLDWARSVAFRWQGQNLRDPPSGYEWRALDGVFVLGTPTGAVIDVKPVNR